MLSVLVVLAAVLSRAAGSGEARGPHSDGGRGGGGRGAGCVGWEAVEGGGGTAWAEGRMVIRAARWGTFWVRSIFRATHTT